MMGEYVVYTETHKEYLVINESDPREFGDSLTEMCECGWRIMQTYFAPALSADMKNQYVAYLECDVVEEYEDDPNLDDEIRGISDKIKVCEENLEKARAYLQLVSTTPGYTRDDVKIAQGALEKWAAERKSSYDELDYASKYRWKLMELKNAAEIVEK